ncbi:hypothetical protein UFOVP410_124 [uncultured Caudovirales phage]|uniref:Uncharacterized protein n=1 Tax=uncultured Caudovirales phage TaxID=2100421 RepID=A0A6J5M2W7_9CAUD|nr:hypothetical protein UFOVP410_124 [uncultured Caudovirales phage]
MGISTMERNNIIQAAKNIIENCEVTATKDYIVIVSTQFQKMMKFFEYVLSNYTNETVPLIKLKSRHKIVVWVNN